MPLNGHTESRVNSSPVVDAKGMNTAEHVTDSLDTLVYPTALLRSGESLETIKARLKQQFLLPKNQEALIVMSQSEDELAALKTLYQDDAVGLKALVVQGFPQQASLFLYCYYSAQSFTWLEALFLTDELQQLVNQQLDTHQLLFMASECAVVKQLTRFYSTDDFEFELPTLLCNFLDKPNELAELVKHLPQQQGACDALLLKCNQYDLCVLDQAMRNSSESFLILFDCLSSEAKHELACRRDYQGAHLLQTLSLYLLRHDQSEVVLAGLMAQIPTEERLERILSPSYQQTSVMQNCVDYVLADDDSAEKPFSFFKALLSYLKPHDVAKALLGKDLQRRNYFVRLREKPALHQSVLDLLYGEVGDLEEYE